MSTPEERRSANHFFHDVTINELQQLTDLHAQKVSFLDFRKIKTFSVSLTKLSVHNNPKIGFVFFRTFFYN